MALNIYSLLLGLAFLGCITQTSKGQSVEELDDATVFQIYSVQSGRCLTVKQRSPFDDRGYTELTNVQIANCPPSELGWVNHEWFIQKEDSKVSLVNRFSKLCLGLHNGNAVQKRCQNDTSLIAIKFNNVTKLLDAKSNLCLKALGSSDKANVAFRQCNNSISEMWSLESIDE